MEDFYVGKSGRRTKKYSSMSPEYKAARNLKEKVKRESDPEYKAKLSANRLKWRRNNPSRTMLTSAKERAIRFNLPINITVEDIVIPEVCPVLGIELFKGTGQLCSNSPTLDRIVPEKGYVKGNIIVVSHRANRIKNDATPEEILKVAAFFKENSGVMTSPVGFLN